MGGKFVFFFSRYSVLYLVRVPQIIRNNMKDIYLKLYKKLQSVEKDIQNIRKRIYTHTYLKFLNVAFLNNSSRMEVKVHYMNPISLVAFSYTVCYHRSQKCDIHHGINAGKYLDESPLALIRKSLPLFLTVQSFEIQVKRYENLVIVGADTQILAQESRFEVTIQT